MKRECETQRSSRAEALKAICIGLGELVRLLEKLSDDTTMTHNTRSETQILLADCNSQFFCIFGTTFKLDRVQKRLQDPSMNFKDSAVDLQGLQHNLMTNCAWML